MGSGVHFRRNTQADDSTHDKAGHRLNPAAWDALLQEDERFRREYQHPYAWSTTRRRVEELFEDPERLRLLGLDSNLA